MFFHRDHDETRVEFILFWCVLVAIMLFITAVSVGFFQKKTIPNSGENSIIVPTDNKSKNLYHSMENIIFCEDSKSCNACMKDVVCVDCTHECYNRYGLFDNYENPSRDKAMTCNQTCWQTTMIH